MSSLSSKQAPAGAASTIVFEAAGSADGFRLGVEIVRPGGQLVFLGKVDVNQDVAFRWGALMGEKRSPARATAAPGPRAISPGWPAPISTAGSSSTS